MDDVKDVAPEIIEAILKDFNERIDNPVTRQLLEDAKATGANYGIAYRYAMEINTCLVRSINKNLTADVLPNGNFYFNIAERLFDTTLGREYDLITEMAKVIQQSINKENGIGIAAITPKKNVDRIKGIAKHFAYNQYDPLQFDETVMKKIADFTENFSMSVVDDVIRVNAELHNASGLHAVITRVASNGACDWCLKIEGVYDYEDVKNTGNPVFRRHNKCRCYILYKSSKDKDYLSVKGRRNDPSNIYTTEKVDKLIKLSEDTRRNFRSRMILPEKLATIEKRKLIPQIAEMEAMLKKQSTLQRDVLSDYIVAHHENLKLFTPEEMKVTLEASGFKVTPLGRGSLKDIRFEDGGGFKINYAGDSEFQYHPEGGHHEDPYWKVSNSNLQPLDKDIKRGIRYDLDGRIKRKGS